MQVINTTYAKQRRKRKLFTNRRSGGSFLMLTHSMLKTKEFAALSPYGTKLLIEIASQFDGKNNGDLSAAYSVLSKRGWRSAGTLAQAKKELVDQGWLITTRQGGRNKCSLFALSWLPIDECNGKHEHPPERVASQLWKNENSSRREGAIGRKTD